MMDFQGDIVRPGIIDRGHLMVINSVTVSTCLDADDVLLDENVGNVLQSNVNVLHVKVLNTNNLSRLDSAPSLGNIQSTKCKQVNSETLSKIFNIDQRKGPKHFQADHPEGCQNMFAYVLGTSFTNTCQDDDI